MGIKKHYKILKQLENMENKFTKGEWKSVYNGHYYDITTSLDNNKQSFAMTSKNSVLGVTEDTQKANALLISKVPEYHQELLNTIDDLKLLKSNIIDNSKTNERLIDVVDVLQNWIDRKEQLIKEATEL